MNDSSEISNQIEESYGHFNRTGNDSPGTYGDGHEWLDFNQTKPSGTTTPEAVIDHLLCPDHSMKKEDDISVEKNVNKNETTDEKLDRKRDDIFRKMFE